MAWWFKVLNIYSIVTYYTHAHTQTHTHTHTHTHTYTHTHIYIYIYIYIYINVHILCGRIIIGKSIHLTISEWNNGS